MTARKKQPLDLMAFFRKNAQFLVVVGLGGGWGGYTHLSTNSKMDANHVETVTIMAQKDSIIRADRHKEFEAHHRGDSLRDEFMMRQNDTIIRLLKRR